MEILVNNEIIKTNLNPAISVLEFLRDELRLTGTKEGCGEGECGACTILLGELNNNGFVEYKSSAACLLPIGEVNGKHVVTIEGVNFDELNLVQQAMYEHSASQCGFCTPGIVMALVGFALSSENLTLEDAINYLDGNICRCTGYLSIKKSAEEFIKLLNGNIEKKSRISILINKKVLPSYFDKSADKLKWICSKRTENTANNADEHILVGGGTDLLVQKAEQLLTKKIKFVSEIAGMNTITEKCDHIILGGGLSTEKFRRSKIIFDTFPSLKNDLLYVSSTIMRNNGTIAGNIVNASPIGDLSIIFLVLNTTISLEKNGVIRQVKLKDFFKSYKNMDINSGEVLKEIAFPKPENDVKFSFEKVSNRKILDIASCNSAMLIKAKNNVIEEVIISAGGVAPIPFLLKDTTTFLIGKEINAANVKKASELALNEVSPISDIRGSAEYKKKLLGNLIVAHFTKLFPQSVKINEVI